jgi:hypothetical protein
MRRLIYSLFALCLLVSVALAAGGFGAGNNLTGFWQKNIVGGGAATPSISYVSATENGAAATTYTFTDHATGTAGATRKTIVGACGDDGQTNFSIASMTVGGSAAAEVADTANAGAAAQCALYIIDNPSGTTATIAVTFSEAISHASIAVWAAYDLNSSTQTDFAVGFHTSAAAITLSSDIQADGIGVGVCLTMNDAQTTTWVGLTERDDSVGANITITAADTVQASAQTPLTISCDMSGSSDTVGAVAAFR